MTLAASLILTYDQMPERFACHFNASGKPNNWTSPASHVWTMGALGIGVSLFLLSVFYGIRFFPLSTLNLPHRDYWLAPERREETFRMLFKKGAWLAFFEVLFIMGLHLLLVAANLKSPAHLSAGVWWLTAAFVAFGVAWTVTLLRRFSRGRP